MGFADIILGWRQRLARLAGDAARTCYAGIEQKILRYLLWRHADAPYADPPAQAEPLPKEDARRSDLLRVDEGTRLRLGLKRSRKLNVIEDLRMEDRKRSLLTCLPAAEDLLAIEIHPHPCWLGSLVESVVWTEDPRELAQMAAFLRDCQPVPNRNLEPYWRAILRLVRKDGFYYEFEVTRTSDEERETYISCYLPFGEPPHFRDDALGRVLQELAARSGDWAQGDSVPGESLQPSNSFPEL